MEEFYKILDALLLDPSLTLDDYVWIYGRYATGKYYVSTSEISIENRHNVKDDVIDCLVTEGNICDLLKQGKQKQNRVRGKDKK